MSRSLHSRAVPRALSGQGESQLVVGNHSMSEEKVGCGQNTEFRGKRQGQGALGRDALCKVGGTKLEGLNTEGMGLESHWCPPKSACRVEDRARLGSGPRGGPGHHRPLWWPVRGGTSPGGGAGGNGAGRKPTSSGERNSDLRRRSARPRQPPGPRTGRSRRQVGRRRDSNRRQGRLTPGLPQDFARCRGRGEPRGDAAPGSVRVGGSCAGHRSSPRSLGLGWGSPAGRRRLEPRTPVPGRQTDATPGAPAPPPPAVCDLSPSASVIGAGTRDGVRPLPGGEGSCGPGSSAEARTCPAVPCRTSEAAIWSLWPLHRRGPSAGGAGARSGGAAAGRPLWRADWEDPSVWEDEAGRRFSRPNGTVWGRDAREAQARAPVITHPEVSRVAIISKVLFSGPFFSLSLSSAHPAPKGSLPRGASPVALLRLSPRTRLALQRLLPSRELPSVPEGAGAGRLPASRLAPATPRASD